MDDKSVRRLLPARLSRYTDRTITLRRALLEELEEIRASGVAFDREEHTDGICAAGIAIQDANETYVALSIPMPSQRFEGREKELLRILRATREDALAAVGAA